jgi:hypothetical protein
MFEGARQCSEEDEWESEVPKDSLERAKEETEMVMRGK